jgi:hypothetical protein
MGEKALLDSRSLVKEPLLSSSKTSPSLLEGRRREEAWEEQRRRQEPKGQRGNEGSINTVEKTAVAQKEKKEV